VRILLADDERITRGLSAQTLAGWGHEVEEVSSGAEAWERIAAGEEYSLLITDWVMPGLDGPALCRKVRAVRDRRYLPIILFTSLDQTDHVIEGLNAGADAFLSKPLNPAVLLAQIRLAERILELEERLGRRLHDLERASERIQRDLSAAAEVQRSHLPSTSVTLPGVSLDWVYEACETLGGDMFNVFRLDEHHLGVYVLDVSGHGTPAALLSVSISRALGPLPQQGGVLKRTLPDPPYYEIVPPAEVAAEVNRRFPLLEESGRYCTLLYGVLDLRARRFRYTTAGHPGPIEVSANGARMHDAGGGVPIGVVEAPGYDEVEIALESGSRVLLYTDGVTECANRSGELFGERRLLEIAAELGAADGASNIAETVQSLRKRLATFAEGEGLRDDITIVGFRVD
jgi:sigma-B regulation protein RsbU (phosphoserine phosphatase)